MSVSVLPGTSLLVPSLSEASRSLLEWVTLEPCQIVGEPGVMPTHVYFPVSCCVALLMPLVDGTTGLAALVGSEGLVGLESFLGSSSRVRYAIAMVQTGGPAWRLPSSQFDYEVASNFALQQRLTRYILALVSQMARIAACARQHSVEHQLARWLLQSWDRSATRTLPVNAEGAAALLALDRDAALHALARIERGGGVVCEDSQLTLRDRTALAASACCCYAAIRESELRALVPDALSSNASAHHYSIASMTAES